MPSVLAVGLDPVFADFRTMPHLTPELVRSYIAAQLDRVRDRGHEVVSCLVDTGATAVANLSETLATRKFDCVLIGAGLRAPEHLLLFEQLINVVHARAPDARLCFNTSPADSVDAVGRWV